MTADWQTCGEAGYGSYGGGSFGPAVAAQRHAPRGRRGGLHVARCGTVPGEDGRESYGSERDYLEHMAGIAQQQADHHASHGHEDARAAAQHLADHYRGKAEAAG